MVSKSEPDAAKTRLPKLERRTVSKERRFGRRVLLPILTTCALAFAIISAQTHEYLNVVAAMVFIFWIGIALSFLGLVLDRAGDLWSAPAALAESMGLGTTVIASFTGAYYGAIFTLAHVPPGLLWWQWYYR